MNDLLAQFLAECRDLIDTATMDLLALETAPGDKERLDGAFRGFHTLKGAAGIVEFDAMGRLLHAAEEVLVAVRAGSRAVSGELVGDCLACLDQVARWLDEIEAAGEVPATPADTAEALVSRFTASGARETSPSGSPPMEPAGTDAAPVGFAPAPTVETTGRAPDWVGQFLARHQSVRHQARAALRHTPAADCFLRGEDPLAAIARIPGLLAVELTPRGEWPPLDELDPFMCGLVITALTGISADDARAIMRDRDNPAGRDDVDVWPVASGSLRPEALAVLEAQARLAASDTAEGFDGRLASAGLVAANVLRRSGWPDAAAAVADAAGTARSAGNGAAFIAALRAVLDRTEATHTTAAEALSPDRSEDPVARSQTTRALRVDVERIDALVSLVGELTVAKNAMGHTVRLVRDGTDLAAQSRLLKEQQASLDRLAGELQRAVLGIRVLPMRHVFQNFPRVVRDLARELGKTVRLDIEGETTEADKATVEALFEPLLHVLRNAVDHGIETAAERRAASKPQGGTVLLRAARHGDRVIVEVADDGRGIDPAKLRLAAERRGVASAAALEDMPDQAVIDLIFSPGFSTATAVTSLSGRGVGMDAVRTAVARLGGSVAVTGKPRTGTTVVFNLPFTILMARVMTVKAGGQLFGVPVDAVVETARLPRGRVARLGAAEVIVLRDRTVPLIKLAELLDLPRTAPAGGDAKIIVASVGGQMAAQMETQGAGPGAGHGAGPGAGHGAGHGAGQAGAEQFCALEVEAFGERMDVMLRPMEGLVAGVAGLAGTALVGDGGVLIVLDLQELLRCQESPGRQEQPT